MKNYVENFSKFSVFGILVVGAAFLGCRRVGTLSDPVGDGDSGVRVEIRVVEILPDSMVRFAFLDGTEDSFSLRDVAFIADARDVRQRLNAASSIAILYEANHAEKAKYRLWIDGEEL